MALKTKKTEDDRKISQRLRAPSQQVRISYSAVAKLVAKRFVFAVAAVFVAVLVLYVCFAATLLRVVPTLDGAGMVPVKNMTYEGGVIPEGEVILVNRYEAQEGDIFSHLRQAFVPAEGAMVVQVHAGPYGKMDWTEPDILSVDGKPVNAPVTAVMVPESDKIGAEKVPTSPIADREDPFLKSEYVGQCLAGACAEGTGVLFHQDNIYGTVINDEEYTTR
jgi:hypothetical protein